jgi:hypothetical protein
MPTGCQTRREGWRLTRSPAGSDAKPDNFRRSEAEAEGRSGGLLQNGCPVGRDKGSSWVPGLGQRERPGRKGDFTVGLALVRRGPGTAALKREASEGVEPAKQAIWNRPQADRPGREVKRGTVPKRAAQPCQTRSREIPGDRSEDGSSPRVRTRRVRNRGSWSQSERVSRWWGVGRGVRRLSRDLVKVFPMAENGGREGRRQPPPESVRPDTETTGPGEPPQATRKGPDPPPGKPGGSLGRRWPQIDCSGRVLSAMDPLSQGDLKEGEKRSLLSWFGTAGPGVPARRRHDLLSHPGGTRIYDLAWHQLMGLAWVLGSLAEPTQQR